MKLKFGKYFFIILFFLYLFLVYDTGFHGPDEPIYLAYTASIVEDGDLNAINNFYRDGKFVSKTYNLPDPRNYGGVLLWWPFYAYAKVIYFIAVQFNLTNSAIEGFSRLANCAMSFSTIVFGFFCLMLSYRLCRIFFSSRIALWSTLIIFLGIPFFYYMLYETGNANILACLFCTLLIWFCGCMVNMKKSHWFLFGLFFSICIVIKIDLWLNLLFIFPFFVILCMSRQIDWKNGIYFIVGFIPGFILRTINVYLKYGAFQTEEAHFKYLKLNLSDYRFVFTFEWLFNSYRGLFYMSPIFLVCLLGFILLATKMLKKSKPQDTNKKIKDIFLFILVFYAIGKLFFIGVISGYKHGVDLAARHVLTEFPIFVLLCASLLQNRNKYLRYFVAIISAFFVFWNMLIVSEYMTGLDWTYITGAPGIYARIIPLKHVLFVLFGIKDLNLKLKFCLPLVIVVYGIIFYMKSGLIKSNFYPFLQSKDEKTEKK